MCLGVQDQLQLAPQQEHDMRAAHEMLSSNLAQLLLERKALAERLQVSPGFPHVFSHALGTTGVHVPDLADALAMPWCILQSRDRADDTFMAFTASSSADSSQL